MNLTTQALLFDMAQDLRHGFRLIRKSPGFALVAVTTLALGIGANTAIFSVVNGVLLRPLGYPDPDRLTMVWEDSVEGRNMGFRYLPVAYGNFASWKEQSRTFAQLAIFEPGTFLMNDGDQPARIGGARVSANFFATLGVKPVVGRLFYEAEEQMGRDRVVLISNRLWKSRFGSRPTIYKERIVIDERPYRIAGVLPPGFQFPQGSDMPSYFQYEARADLWVPLAVPDRMKADHGNHSSLVMGRLKPGVPLAQAQAEMSTLAHRLALQFPETNTGFEVQLVSLQNQVAGAVRPAQLALLSAAGLVLLITCINLAQLLVARMVSRQKEIAVRVAIGANRPHLILQSTMENFALALLGGGLGLLLGYAGMRGFVAFSPLASSRMQEVGMDIRVVGFTVLVSLSTLVIFGFAPAFQLSGRRLNEFLKEGTSGAGGGSKQWLRSSLVLSEIALSLVLLIGAALVMATLHRLVRVQPGFRPDRVLAAEITLTPSTFRRYPQTKGFLQEVVRRIERIPGVESVGATAELPFKGQESVSGFSISGQGAVPRGQEPLAARHEILPGYFRTMNVPQLAGRDFNDHDIMGAPQVAIVNESLKRRFFPRTDPVGTRIKFGAPEENTPWLEIVGVVGDVRHYALDREPSPTIFLPFLQQPSPSVALVVRGSAGAAGLASVVRSQAREVDKNQAVDHASTMDQLVANSLLPRQFCLVVLGLFAGTALLLAMVGLYGLISYSVRQRSHEIGIRVALGAEARHVVTMIVRHGLVLSIAGIALGIVAALAATRVLRSLLFGVSSSDIGTFVGISLLLLAMATVASYVPARRAAQVDPMKSLRLE